MSFSLIARILSILSEKKTNSDIMLFKESKGVYPSKADIPSIGVWTDPNDNKKKFNPSYITSTYLGSSLAPRGSIIINPFENKDYPRAVVFYGGRVFYASGSSVYFSVLIQNERAFGKCHQENDPTSELSPDILDTDGGEIIIQNSVNIFKLVVVGANLVIFADNGVWQINGADGGFTPTSYSVEQVSSDGALNANVVSELPTTVAYISKRGLNVLQPEKISGTFTPVDLTYGTIKTYFDTLNKESLSNAKILYSKNETRLYIALNNDTQERIEEVLVFDEQLSCWFKYNIEDSVGFKIKGLYNSSDSSVFTTEESITYLTEQVTFEGEEVVLSYDSVSYTVPQITFLSLSSKDLYDLSESYVRTFTFKDTAYTDFGSPYPAYFITASNAFGSLGTKKRINQVDCLFEKTETGYYENEEGGLEYLNPSGCTLQVGWDYPSVESYDDDLQNNWSKEYQVYSLNRYESKSLGDVPARGIRTLKTKTMVRGTGNSALFKFSAEEGKACRILGWKLDLFSTSR